MTGEASVDYYRAFEQGGWDISLMRECLGNIELPTETLDSLRGIESANLLVLGSANTRNIGNMASIDKVLRPGQGHNDKVLMVDLAEHPMRKHIQEWDWLKSAVAQGGSYDDLHYPGFVFAQADMKHLPLQNGVVDVVVSDYTLNFLDSYPDVLKTFAEIERVLTPDGLALLSIAGHEDVDPNIPADNLEDKSPQQVERKTMLVTNQFPIQMYIEAARQNGLELVGSSWAGNDLTCAVFKKIKK